VMLSCAQELKRREVANANASFDFMVVEIISTRKCRWQGGNWGMVSKKGKRKGTGGRE